MTDISWFPPSTVTASPDLRSPEEKFLGGLIQGDLVTFDVLGTRAAGLPSDASHVDDILRRNVPHPEESASSKSPVRRGWRNQERATLYRAHRLVASTGIAVLFEEGETEEGDPWCIFLNPEGEVIAHIARVDGLFILDSVGQTRVISADTLESLVDRYAELHRHAATSPTIGAFSIAENVIQFDRPQRRRTVFLHPSAAIAALLWSIYTASEGLCLPIGGPKPDTDGSPPLGWRTLSDACAQLPEALRGGPTELVTSDRSAETHPNPVRAGLRCGSEDHRDPLTALAPAVASLGLGQFAGKAMALSLGSLTLALGLPIWLRTPEGEEEPLALQIADDILALDIIPNADPAPHPELADQHRPQVPREADPQGLHLAELPEVTKVTSGFGVDVALPFGSAAVAERLQPVPARSHATAAFSDCEQNTHLCDLGPETVTPPLPVVVEASADEPVAAEEGAGAAAGTQFSMLLETALKDSLLYFDVMELEVLAPEAQSQVAAAIPADSLDTADLPAILAPSPLPPSPEGEVEEPVAPAQPLPPEPAVPAYAAFDTAARAFVDFVLQKLDATKKIATPTELVLIDSTAFDGIADAVWARSWTFGDGGTISVIGNKADFDLFDLVA